MTEQLEQTRIDEWVAQFSPSVREQMAQTARHFFKLGAAAYVEKEIAICQVLAKRRAIVNKCVEAKKARGESAEASYYEGKGHGYDQAADLLRESTKSIRIEL